MDIARFAELCLRIGAAMLCTLEGCTTYASMAAHDCRLSYKGLGEPLCFLAFGPLALGAFYLAQVSTHHCEKPST